MKAFLLFFGFICMFSFVYAHSGRTDANGCHTNRKTGTYHCHGKSKKKISAARPVVSNKKASAKSDKLSQTEDKKETSKKKKVAIKNKKKQSKSTNKAENTTKSIKGNNK